VEHRRGRERDALPPRRRKSGPAGERELGRHVLGAAVDRALDEADHAAMRRERALRAARRTARVEDHRGVVLGDRDVGQRGGGRSREQRSELGLDLERRQREAERARACEARAVSDQDARRAVRDAVSDLVRRPPAVQRGDDRAEARRRPERDRPLRAVGGEDRDAVALGDAVALAQHAHERGDLREMLRVRDALLAVHEVLGVAVRGGRP
jgi:hypothetical protein